MKLLKGVLVLVAVILVGVLLIAAALTASWYNHAYRIALHNYVCVQVEPAALKCENTDYQGSLREIDRLQPLSHPALMETHYVKALCLQALGRFPESRAEYSYVAREAGQEDLKERCAIGEGLATVHSRDVRWEQVRFPDYTQAADGI